MLGHHRMLRCTNTGNEAAGHLVPCPRRHTGLRSRGEGRLVAHWVKRLTLGFGSDRDLGIVGSSPASGSTLTGDLLEILSPPSTSALPPALSLK